jgi:hypothetical protein
VAYRAYLFDPNPDSVTYSGRVHDGGITQTREIKTRGATDEWFLAFGGNLANKVMLGAMLGFPTVDFVEEWWHMETDHMDTIPGFTGFTQYSYLRTRGTGINAKLGATGLLGKRVRIGVALHSPSFIGLRDGYYTYIDNADLVDDVQESPVGNYRYGLRTPMRGNAGIAVMFDQAGYVSVDYEVVDYGTAAFLFKSPEDDLEAQLNQAIRDKYGVASNLRVGGELVLQAYRLRAGAQFMGSPFKPGIAPAEADYSRRSISAGGGYRGRSFFVDVAYVITSSSHFYVPYTLADPDEVVPGAIIDKVYHNIIFTTGFKLR